jgi:hypothetical protein
MAKIEVIGFVSDWKFGEKEPNPTWAMKVSEPHQKKIEGKYVKAGSTNYTVKAAYGVEIDFSQYRQGDRVEIIGTQLSEEWESGDKKGKNLVIKASSVRELQRGQHEEKSVGTREEAPSTWIPVDEDAPF